MSVRHKRTAAAVMGAALGALALDAPAAAAPTPPSKPSSPSTAKPKKATHPANARVRHPRPNSLAPIATSPRSDGNVYGVDDPDATPAIRYASFDAEGCARELGRRQVAFARVAAEDARGVLAPVRLQGSLGGVAFHSQLAPRARETSPYEIFDCRLVLALDDWAKILARHGVVEVVHYSAYRPPAAWADGQLGKQHEGGLALDVGSFVLGNGETWNVEKDFHGRIGARTCGDGAGPTVATAAALALRALVCESADLHLFNVTLTPDYNWVHRNHFHVEVTAGVRWFLVH
jgi:hypothetical protein